MNKLLIFEEALDKSNEMCYTIFVNENRMYRYMLKVRYIMGIEQSKKTLDKVIQDIAKREAMIEKTTEKINTTREKLVIAEVWNSETDTHIGDIWQYDAVTDTFTCVIKQGEE